MKFEEWMKSSGLSQSTADKYSGAISGPLSKWAIEHQLTAKPIDKIVDPVEFAAVAKLIEGMDEYQDRNATGHSMYGAALKRFQQYLSQLNAPSSFNVALDGPCAFEVSSIESAENFSPFNPIGQEDARQKVLREVVQRRGQPKFRSALIEAYEGRCVITGCAILAILEAAHITPYLGPATNSMSNGLLLRTDIHTLWDLALIAVDPGTNAIWVNPTISDPEYQALKGRVLARPVDPTARPSVAAIQAQWALALTDVN